MLRETEVETGKVRGVALGWPCNTAYYGIPYAAPPVGELRWRAPQPAAPWQGVRDCARPSAKCPQLGVGPGSFYEKEFYPADEEQSEDCLYLNVWTPAQSREERLPVMFWIHGGAFMTGYGHSAHFDGEHFARQGVILVTVNYRLNIFGWLTHPELDAENARGISGNYGLLDQIAALAWVRRNIAAFGGDPGKITLAGQSAGAASVQALICSPLTKGLYRQAILQSGGGPVAIMDTSFPRLRDTEKAIDLGELGVASIAEARKLTGLELRDRWIAALMRTKGRLPFVFRSPVVDGYVLEETCEEAIRAGHTPAMPVLIGYTNHENLRLFSTRRELEAKGPNGTNEVSEAYLALCPQDGPDFEAYIEAATTETAQAAAEVYAEVREAQGKGDTYVYALERSLPGDEMGPFHAADLWYVFRTLTRSWRPWEAEDYMLAYACNTYWANFVKNGVPNGGRKPLLPEWRPYKAEEPLTMRFDKACVLETRARNARVAQRKRDLKQEDGE